MTHVSYLRSTLISGVLFNPKCLLNALNCFCWLPVVGDHYLSAEERVVSADHKHGEVADILEREEGEVLKENGERRSNRLEAETKSDGSADRPHVVDDHQGKSRFTSHSCRISVIVYSYGWFQILYIIKIWWTGAKALVLKGPWARVWVLVPRGFWPRARVLGVLVLIKALQSHGEAEVSAEAQ